MLLANCMKEPVLLAALQSGKKRKRRKKKKKSICSELMKEFPLDKAFPEPSVFFRKKDEVKEWL